MPSEPQIKPLTYGKRTWFFRSLFLLFAIVLPIVVFYATGYRFDLTKDSPIIVTGGMYVSVPASNGKIYIDDEPVNNVRIFRRASYIQNLSVGMHQIHVQGDGLQTWVKELPVRSHIVTEAEAFNMPAVPQVRLISEWLDVSGRTVFVGKASTTLVADFSFASSTNLVTATTSTATSTLQVNEEYGFVESFFGTSTVEESLVARMVENVNEAFTFAETGTTSATTTATTTIANRDMTLYEDQGEVYALWTGDRSDIPYYFCIYHEAASTTVARYGEHVFDSLANALASIPPTETESVVGRICRDKIKIDRKNQTVHSFTFLPGSTDHVLMQLEEGLYIVEIDDRAWQNAQLLYPGRGIEMRVEGDRIYVRDRGYLLEVFTEIESS